MGGFGNPIIGGGGSLVYPSIHSPNFQTGVMGWTINKDGSAEFSSAIIRGAIVSGTIVSGPSTGAHIEIDPNISVGFNSGFLEAVVGMFTDDVNQMMQGMLGVVTFDAGNPNETMASILHSPMGTGGYAIVLEADADDLSRLAHASIGPVTTDGMSMSYQELHMFESYGIATPAYLSYGQNNPSQQVQTFNASGSWVAPNGVTSVKVECWGGGGAGAHSAGSGPAGGGGGGAEYARNAAVAVTPGNTYNFTVGAGAPYSATNTAPSGGTSTFTGDAAVTVIAHGGASANSSNGAAGGSGSGSSVHHNGGNGATTAFGGGGGGGGAAGTNNVGGLANPGQSSGAGGSGGVGGSAGGGSGGTGGNNNGSAGGNGFSPGGGGGGQGDGTSPNGGNGANGQIRLTFTPALGTGIVLSAAAAAGTDHFGNNFPAGFAFGQNLIPIGKLAISRSTAAGPTATSTTTDVKDTAVGDITFTAVSGRSYRLKYKARAQATTGTVAGDWNIRGNNSAVSPTTASTLLTAASIGLATVGGSGATDLMADAILACPGDIAAGQWTIAGFVHWAAGAGTITANQSTGQKRELSVEDVGGP